MNDQSIYEAHWKKAMSYENYLDLTRGLLEEDKTTGNNPEQEDLVEYTELNLQRMMRVWKTTELDQSLVKDWKELKDERVLLVITEAWCGDAAQSVPVLAKLSEESGLKIKIVLRDDNPALMNLHLTNGGKSIPIAILLKSESFELVSSWGPRPEPAQEMVKDYKSADEPKAPYTEFVKEVQMWYAKDKQKTIQKELQALMAD